MDVLLDKINTISQAVELVSRYLQESVKNFREIIDDEFSPTVSSLEYLRDIDLETMPQAPPEILNDLANIANIADIEQLADNISQNNSAVSSVNTKLQEQQEDINRIFNNSFEIIDGIVPEEESQEIVILREEVAKLLEIFNETDLYEVKTTLQNILTKLDFVMNATNTFTISEILEVRNDLSSAAAKFNTSCIDVVQSDTTFFDIANKMAMLQSSSVYAKEIKEDIEKLKRTVEDSSIVEIINMVIEILDFIIENSVQLEEQMTQTLKSGVEYCASPNESIDGDLIIQQLENHIFHLDGGI